MGQATVIILKDSSVLYSTNINGVETTLCGEMYFALGVAAALKKQLFGLNCVVTSLLDGHHGDGSLHPMGRAADLRDSDLSPAERMSWFQALKDNLEIMGFDVVWEGGEVPATVATDAAMTVSSAAHIHLEFDEKGRKFWH